MKCIRQFTLIILCFNLCNSCKEFDYDSGELMNSFRIKTINEYEKGIGNAEVFYCNAEEFVGTEPVIKSKHRYK